MKYSKHYRNFVPLLILLLIALVVYVINLVRSKTSKVNIDNVPIVQPENIEIQRRKFPEIVKEILTSEGYQNWRNWVATSAHETNNFKSDLFLRANNPWGMKMPKVRRTTAIAESNGYAVYPDLIAAVNDLIYYMREFNYPKGKDISLEDQIAFMKNVNYFEDSFNNYLTGSKYWFSKYFS